MLIENMFYWKLSRFYIQKNDLMRKKNAQQNPQIYTSADMWQKETQKKNVAVTHKQKIKTKKWK